MSLFRALRKTFSRTKRVPTGMYSYRGRGRFEGLALQLRVEPDGRGLLVINANTVLHLNRTAAFHAFYFMQGMSTNEAVKQIMNIFRVGLETVRKDHEEFIYTVSTLAQTEEVCPITYLNVEQVEPFSQTLSAPIRMDLALTFRCQNNCVHCYTGGPHETPELTTGQWKKVMDRLFNIGVFVFNFTGGEPTLREDLSELIGYAQKIGVVTGLVTNGRRLKDKEYLQRLVDAGLDYVQITLESHDPGVHNLITRTDESWEETVEGIKNVIPTPIYVTTNTTLNRYNYKDFLKTMDFLHDLGVTTFGCNSLIYSGSAPPIADEFALSINELRELLPKIRIKAGALEMKFLWYTPTEYCQLNPVNLGLGVKTCTAASVNMCIGPEGEVYPCQSYFETVGNILKDGWEKIWNHTLCRNLRAREYAPEKCDDCPELSICGGGCPLEREAKYICAETQ